MASITPLKDIISNTSLGEMDKCLSRDPFPLVKITCKEYDVVNQKLHEAGYDAFLTGYCYVRMLHYLESFNSSKSALVDFYVNKIFLMKTYDMSFIDLKNPQEDPKRDNVFYLEFPSSWETQDIYDLFAPFGSIFIAWVDEKSSFVALQNVDNVKKAAAQLVGVSGREYRVYFYHTYVNQLNKNKGKSVNLGESSKKNTNTNQIATQSNINNSQNGSGDKRKRTSPPKNLELKKNTTKTGSPQNSMGESDGTGSDGHSENKKLKNE